MKVSGYVSSLFSSFIITVRHSGVAQNKNIHKNTSWLKHKIRKLNLIVTD